MQITSPYRWCFSLFIRRQTQEINLRIIWWVARSNLVRVFSSSSSFRFSSPSTNILQKPSIGKLPNQITYFENRVQNNPNNHRPHQVKFSIGNNQSTRIQIRFSSLRNYWPKWPAHRSVWTTTWLIDRYDEATQIASLERNEPKNKIKTQNPSLPKCDT